MKIWTIEEEAQRLSLRFSVINQAAFARKHEVPGGASMVNQHIKGHRPMNLAAARAYARGFGCSLADISPRLAAEVEAANKLQRTSTMVQPNTGSMLPANDKKPPRPSQDPGAALLALVCALDTQSEGVRNAALALVTEAIHAPNEAPRLAKILNAMALCAEMQREAT